MANAPLTSATVEQPSLTKPPIMTPGDMTPKVLLDFEVGCETYYIQKGTAEADKVKMVAFGLTDPKVREWYIPDRVRINAMSFAAFMTELRTSFLPGNWQAQIRQKVLSSRQGDRPFWEWQSEVRNNNALLVGVANFHLAEAAMLSQLEANLNEELKASIIADPPLGTTLRDWIMELKIRDEQATKTREQMTTIAASLIQADRLRRRKEREQAPIAHPGRTRYAPAAATHITTSSTTTTAAATSYPPKLTDAERDLLNKHRGCTKCRKFYVNHMASTCPNGFASGNNYKKLTEGDAIAARPIKAEAVTAILGEASTILGDGTDSDDSDSAAYVPSFSGEHFTPDCSITGPSTTFPIPINPLVDGGCPTVLIRPDLVDQLGLRRRPLPKPEPASGAFQGESVMHTEWVKIKVLSGDKQWTSRTIRAKVAPSLCTKLILGIPFLSHNKLVLDASERTLIDKRSGYDLMHPPPTIVRKPAEPPRKPAEKPVATKKRSIGATPPPLPPPPAATIAQVPVELVLSIRERIETLATLEQLQIEEEQMRKRFADRFPNDIPHIDDLPRDVIHRIKLKDANQIIAHRAYATPQKYKDAWKILLNQHITAGRIRPSCSPYASPAFIVPKADPNVLPRWVNDYRTLNANTVRDRTPLPRIEEILADCAKGRIFGKIDMTNSFFQTPVHPDDVPYTAVHTPFGLYEWLVMPMGLTNSPATHQRRMYWALKHLIGNICHVYLDDIVIWSQTVEEHRENVAAVLQALRENSLFCSPKKSTLFTTEINFLGHVINASGVHADPKKVQVILEWPQPRSTTHIRAFLGIVRYLANFLPNLAEHTAILTPLTKKEYNKDFPGWTKEHQAAFAAIKEIVVSRDCLTVIDHASDDTIFVTTDASDRRTGAVLSVGKDWKTARPVAFESQQLNAAEKNYPVHEKELLAIVRALKKWRFHLLGTKFEVHTDHRTLEFFNTQRDLSRRQARWAEYLSQYEYDLHYVKGEDNTVADALSRYPEEAGGTPQIIAAVRGLTHLPNEDTGHDTTVGATFEITSDPEILEKIKAGYKTDEFCQKLKTNLSSIEGARLDDDTKLLYVGSRLVIPRHSNLREILFQMAHDALGHFGFDKSYETLRYDYYWPGMRSQLEGAYIPSCTDCQRNKSPTKNPVGPLHPLPIPDKRFDSVAIDFIGPLPEDEGYDGIMTMTDRLGGADIRICPIRMDITAEKLAVIFFDEWYCENGLPLNIISDRDHLFVSKFWKALHKLTGVKIKMSTAYHPETDGASERTNKTVNQLLRLHVDRSQRGWVRALPRIRFCIMNTVNMSTGYSPFQLKSGTSPRIMPPLTRSAQESAKEIDADAAVTAMELITQLHRDVKDAQDNLLASKTRQAHFANAHRSPEDRFKAGDRVMLSTKNRRRDYRRKGKKRVDKFMPRNDGPYIVVKAFADKSEYTLKLPNSPRTFSGFHASQLRRYHPNDSTLFPLREIPKPGPIVTEDGTEEWLIDRIIDERKRGRGFQYLVRWKDWGVEDDDWLPHREVEETEALDIWLAKKAAGEV